MGSGVWDDQKAALVLLGVRVDVPDVVVQVSPAPTDHPRQNATAPTDNSRQNIFTGSGEFSSFTTGQSASGCLTPLGKTCILDGRGCNPASTAPPV